jgi:hypothetical protein
MATAKPKTKRMMMGGFAKPAAPKQSSMQAAAKQQGGSRIVPERLTPQQAQQRDMARTTANATAIANKQQGGSRIAPTAPNFRAVKVDPRAGQRGAQIRAAQIRAAQMAAKSQQPDAGIARAFADMQKQREAQQKLDAARPTGNAPMGQGPQTVANLKNNMREISPADFKKVVGKKAGGLAAGHKQADGIAKKGKTKAMQVKMAGGGKTKKYC